MCIKNFLYFFKTGTHCGKLKRNQFGYNTLVAENPKLQCNHEMKVTWRTKKM